MTRKVPLKNSIQYEIFNRIEFDPTVERMDVDSYRVFLPRKWINKMNFNDDYFFIITGSGVIERYNGDIDYVRSYLDITLIDGHKEYMDMMEL